MLCSYTKPKEAPQQDANPLSKELLMSRNVCKKLLRPAEGYSRC